MRRARALAAGMLVVGLLAAIPWGARRVWVRPGRAAEPPRLVVSTVAREQELLVTVDQTGVLAAKDSLPVLPEIAGGVIVWLSDNGIPVAKGAPVARFDPRDAAKQLADVVEQYQEALRKLEQAKAQQADTNAGLQLRLDRAKADAAAFERQQRAALRELEESIKFQQTQLEQRRRELDTKRRLADKGLIAGTEVEREEAGVRSAEFELQRSRTDLELKQAEAEAKILEKRQAVTNTEQDLRRSQRQSENQMRMAQNSVDSLKLTLGRAQQDLAKMTVVAPAAGLLVMNQEYSPGDRIWRAQALAHVVDLSHMLVKLELDQRRVVNLKVGQEALVDIDALPGKLFPGKVTEIGQTAHRPASESSFMGTEERTFPVTIELPPAQQTAVRPGMRGNARIVVRRVKKAIVIPAECIFRRQGKPIVYALRAGRYQAVPVKLGASDGDYTAITSGLQAGERVALNDLASAAAPAPAAPTAKATPGPKAAPAPKGGPPQ